MSVIVIRPRAKTDLAEIWDYIADDSEERADAFIEKIDNKFRAIVEQPNVGRAREELETGLRSFPIARYVIFYRTIPEGVEIVRVLHGARDLDAIFHSNE